METGKLIFITGGVRSGKSSFAEQLAMAYAEGKKRKLHYIACGVPFDQEMQDRVKRHQRDREDAVVAWKTWEQPVYLTEIASAFGGKDVLLLDCITTLLNNYLYKEKITDEAVLFSQIIRDIESLRKRAAVLLVVSNEVLQDTSYEEEFTRAYQSLSGSIHHQLVKEADQAILVESGIPLYKKG